MQALTDIIRGVRNIRNKMNIEKKLPLTLVISADSKETLAGIKEHQEMIKHQANLGDMKLGTGLAQPKHSATEVAGKLKLFIPLEGIIDLELEKERLESKTAVIKRQIDAVRKKLDNAAFCSRAPETIIKKKRDKLSELSEQLKILRESIGNLTN